jgi:hypothetical protein
MYSQSESQRAQESAAEDARAEQRAAEERSRAYAEEQRLKAVEEQKRVAAENETKWKEYAFPNKTEMAAKQAETAASLGNERTKRLDQLSRTASLRGWGPGSGTLAAGASGIEGDYLTALGKASTDLTQYANKAQFAYPFGTSSVGSAASYPTSNYLSPNANYNTGWSNPLAAAMGMYMYKNMSGSDTNNTNNYAEIPFTDYTDWTNSIYG